MKYLDLFDNFYLPNMIDIIPLPVSKALEEWKGGNKSLILSLYPLYKHYWSKAKLRLLNNRIILDYGNVGNAILPISFRKIVLLASYDDYLLIKKEDSPEKYEIDHNAYSYIKILNMEEDFDIFKLSTQDGLGIIKDSARYGFLTQKWDNKSPKLTSPESKFKFSSVPLKSLKWDIQTKILEVFLRRQNFVLTGGTGVGKTSQIPKLLWWFNYLFDGFSVFSSSVEEDTRFFFNTKVTMNHTVLSLPRKVLISSNGNSIRRSIGFQEPRGSPLLLKYKDVEQNENDYNPNPMESPLVLVVNQLALSYASKSNSFIIDEFHEHDTYALVSISILYKKFKNLRNIVIMTATLEDDVARIKEYFKDIVFIDIPGETLFDITTRIIPILKYDTIITTLIQQNLFPLGTSIIIFKSSKLKVSQVAKSIKALIPTKYAISVFEASSSTEDLPSVINKIQTNKGRSIVVGTPILESSITITNAVAVIDDCKFYMVHFRTGFEETITRSMQVQRKGRVGRVRRGVYIASELIGRSKYKKIDHQYLYPFIIYSLKFNLKFSDLFMLPSDMKRFDKSISYLFSKDIDIKKNIEKYYEIYRNNNCTLIEYLKVYTSIPKSLMGQFSDFDTFQDESKISTSLKKYLAVTMNNRLIRVDAKNNLLHLKLQGEFEDPIRNVLKVRDIYPQPTLFLIGRDIIYGMG